MLPSISSFLLVFQHAGWRTFTFLSQTRRIGGRCWLVRKKVLTFFMSWLLSWFSGVTISSWYSTKRPTRVLQIQLKLSQSTSIAKRMGFPAEEPRNMSKMDRFEKKVFSLIIDRYVSSPLHLLREPHPHSGELTSIPDPPCIAGSLEIALGPPCTICHPQPVHGSIPSSTWNMQLSELLHRRISVTLSLIFFVSFCCDSQPDHFWFSLSFNWSKHRDEKYVATVKEGTVTCAHLTSSPEASIMPLALENDVGPQRRNLFWSWKQETNLDIYPMFSGEIHSKRSKGAVPASKVTRPHMLES